MIDFCPLCGQEGCHHLGKVWAETHDLVLIEVPLPQPSNLFAYVPKERGFRVPQPDGTYLFCPLGESPADDKYLKAWEERKRIDPNKVDLRAAYMNPCIVAKLRARSN